MGERSEFKTLREWTPMTRFLQKIPLKAQRGLFTHDLNLTCVDCLPDYLVLGTNVGIVYWYDRRKDELQRLRCENTSSPIICIRVVSTIDFMVAAGSEDGNVSVFQIPKPEPVATPVPKPVKSRQIERFTISGLHLGPVSALEWSPNGMNLFSGDRSGIIVLTEIDFYMHLSKSREVLNEKYEVVQLSYRSGAGIPQGKLLLVSTVYRTTLCSWRQEERTWKVMQLGQRERKSLGQFGATFYHPVGVGNAHHRDIIFASRPGLRLWQAGLDGIVQQTLIFKDALMCPHPSIMLVNPVPSRFKQTKVPSEKNLSRRRDSEEKTEERHGLNRPDSAGGFQHQVGFLHPFEDGLLVAHWKGPNGSILVLDPEDTGVIASVKTGTGGLRSIISVAVTPALPTMEQSHSNEDSDSLEKGPEIFVLEGGRSLIRISNLPDYHYSKAGLEEPEESIGSSMRSLFASTIFPPSLIPSPAPLLKDLTASFLELTTGPGVSHLKVDREGESSSSSRGDAGSSMEAAAANPPSPQVQGVMYPREKGPKHLGVIMADEAVEVPPVLDMPFEEIPALHISSVDGAAASSGDAGRGMGAEAPVLSSGVFEEILYKPKKRKKKKKKSSTSAPVIIEPEGSSTRSTASEEDTSQKVSRDGLEEGEGVGAVGGQITQEGEPSREGRVPRRLPLSEAMVRSRWSQEVIASNLSPRSSVVEEGQVGRVEMWLPSMPLAPDLRSPTSIQQDVESKEELLAKLLDLKPISSQPVPKLSAMQGHDLSPEPLIETHPDSVTAGLQQNYEPLCWFLDTSVNIDAVRVDASSYQKKRKGQQVASGAAVVKSPPRMAGEGPMVPPPWLKEAPERSGEEEGGDAQDQARSTADKDSDSDWEVIEVP
ncbi:WD repeat-containing protein CG11141 [Hetaerina americana]|uniref:WD repeat-containing protein CG11141 n=1 Tax=Hetaerina americana TaxID=62018 RepID=UPI003A7F1288